MRPLIVLLPLVLVAACDRHKAPPPQQSTQPPASAPAAEPEGIVDRAHHGEAAPAKPFRDAAGAPATLSAFRGKPLLVNLWATWCVPCIRELPTLDALAGGTTDLKVIAVNQDLGGAETAAPFLAKHPVKSLAAYTDPDMGLMNALAAGNLPTTVLYDRHGKELWRVTGPLDWSGAKAKALLAEAK